MAVVKDWITEAAREIALHMTDPEQRWAYYQTGKLDVGLVAWVEGRILEHCPWKPDTAYIEVPRCGTCRHWDPMDSHPLGDCNSPKMMKGYNFELEEIPLDGVELESDEGWSMHTGRDFGCVQWETK